MINYETDILFSFIFGCSVKMSSAGLYYSIYFRSPIWSVFHLLVMLGVYQFVAFMAPGIGSERYLTYSDMYYQKAKN